MFTIKQPGNYIPDMNTNPKTKTASMHLRITPKLKRLVAAFSKKKHWSVTTTVEQALIEYIKNND